MKATFQVAGIDITTETEDVKALFREVASIHEVFGHTTCALCQGDAIPVHRQAGGYDFYEMKCLSCSAKLSFGQQKEGGGLFPIRALDKDGKPDWKNGTFGPHMGWTMYRGNPVNGDADQAQWPAGRCTPQGNGQQTRQNAPGSTQLATGSNGHGNGNQARVPAPTTVKELQDRLREKERGFIDRGQCEPEELFRAALLGSGRKEWAANFTPSELGLATAAAAKACKEFAARPEKQAAVDNIPF